MSSYASGNLNLITMSMPSEKSNYYGPLMLSILNGMQTNPEMFRAYLKENREISEGWRQTLSEENELVSDLNTA